MDPEAKMTPVGVGIIVRNLLTRYMWRIEIFVYEEPPETSRAVEERDIVVTCHEADVFGYTTINATVFRWCLLRHVCQPTLDLSEWSLRNVVRLITNAMSKKTQEDI